MVRAPGAGDKWQISMVGCPGRSSLNQAMEILARIIRDAKDLLR